MASVRERTSKTGERSWAVLYRVGKKQRSRTFSARRPAEKFARLIDAMGAERAQRELDHADTRTGLTVGELADQWLAWKADRVTPRTHEDYTRDVDNWVRPWFGDTQADDVDEAAVQKWVDHMGTTLARKSVAGRHALLHAMYAFGKRRSRGLVQHNPCQETELPEHVRKPPKGTTLVEWRAIMAADRARPQGGDAADLILFLGSMGWRWSEGAGLGVRDVIDDGEHLWVDVTRVFRMVAGKQVLVEDAAKTWAGFRRSRVPSEVAAMLRRRVVGKGPEDFVFTNSRGRPWNQNTFLRDTWPRLLQLAEVGSETRKPTPHWLRHMAVANLASSGRPMHEIQRIIGHDDIQTTNTTYGGMIGGLSADGVAALDAVLGIGPAAGEVVQGEVVEAGSR